MKTKVISLLLTLTTPILCFAEGQHGLAEFIATVTLIPTIVVSILIAFIVNFFRKRRGKVNSKYIYLATILFCLLVWYYSMKGINVF